MIIRKAEKKELPDIADLYREVYAEYPYHEKWTTENVLLKMRELYASGKILIALDGEEVVGFIMYQIETRDTYTQMFIDDLGVKKDHRGKRIASQFLMKVEEDAKSEGVLKIELISNTKSNAFSIYKKKGYRETGWVVMNKEIAP